MSSFDNEGEAPLPFLVLNGDHMLSTVVGVPEVMEIYGLLFLALHVQKGLEQVKDEGFPSFFPRS